VVAADLFHDKGFNQTTTKEIADACKMSVGTLYYYIDSKDDLPALFSQLALKDADKWEKGIRKLIPTLTPDKLLHKAIDDYMVLIDRTEKLLLFWYEVARFIRPDQIDVMIGIEMRTMRLFKDIIKLGCSKGVFKASEPRVYAYAIVMMCHEWALKRFYLHDRYTLKDYTRLVNEMAVKLLSI
jgi:TetR/AcrR family transcriptional regulator, cholesterol catabolism regulator